MAETRNVLDDATARRLSSMVDTQLLRGPIMPEVKHKLADQLDFTYEPTNRLLLPWVDPLCPKLLKLRRLPKSSMQTIRYTGSKPLTSISAEQYGTTTAWYVILLVSGFVHPQEIPPGAILYLPRLQDIKEILAPRQPNRRGQIVKA